MVARVVVVVVAVAVAVLVVRVVAKAVARAVAKVVARALVGGPHFCLILINKSYFKSNYHSCHISYM